MVSISCALFTIHSCDVHLKCSPTALSVNCNSDSDVSQFVYGLVVLGYTVFLASYGLVTVVEPCHENTCLCHMRTTKTLIRVFVIRRLDSIMPLISISKISRL